MKNYRIMLFVVLALLLAGCGSKAEAVNNSSTSEVSEVDQEKEEAAKREAEEKAEQERKAEETEKRLKEGVSIIYSDPDKALSIFEALALEGNSDAEYLQGYIYQDVYTWNYEYDKRNYEKAADLYEKVGSDHPFAQIEYAGLFLYGHGREKDENKANEMISNALKSIDESSIDDLPYSSVAYCRLANLYENGIGTEQDPEKAIEFHKKAADLGNPISTHQLGWIYDRAKGVEQDFDIANYWYWKAISLGNTDSMYDIGYNYENGRGFEQDLEKSFAWYERAANLGNLPAINNLGYSYEFGRGTEKDVEKAYEWYLKGAEQGADDCMNNLARCYENGYGVEKDYSKAVEWYQKSVDLDNPHAMNNLAYNYEEGMGVEKNVEKALDLYLRAFELGNISAMQNMTYTFANGAGTEQDYERARKIAEGALDAGVFSAADFLAFLYDRGLGVDKDTQKAKELRAQSIEMEKAQGESQAGEATDTSDTADKTIAVARDLGEDFLYTCLVMYSNPEEALSFFEKEAENGNEDAIFLAGYIYYETTWRYINDTDKGIELLEKVSDNNPYAKFCLGKCHYWGRGFEQDKELGEKMMDQAFSEIDMLMVDLLPYSDIAYYLIGDYYYLGADKEQYYKEALEAFTKAADVHPQAMTDLGVMYYNGDGVKRDMEKCVDYLEKAANLGCYSAANFLGEIYGEGLGVSVDEQLSAEWYKKAEELQ